MNNEQCQSYPCSKSLVSFSLELDLESHKTSRHFDFWARPRGLTDYAPKIKYYACGRHLWIQSIMLKVILGGMFYSPNYAALKWHLAAPQRLKENVRDDLLSSQTFNEPKLSETNSLVTRPPTKVTTKNCNEDESRVLSSENVCILFTLYILVAGKLAYSYYGMRNLRVFQNCDITEISSNIWALCRHYA